MNVRVDSRLVEKGDTFVALRGIESDGHDYIDKAIINGASKIICEKGTYEVETVLVKDTRKYLTEYLTKEYKYIFDDIKMIGITGTNGKTTSAYLLHDALNIIGIKAAYIGTLGFYIKDKIKNLNNTTPDILDLFELFKIAYENNCKYIVMEVSSQGLSYKRVEGFMFDYAIFTNLTQDHLDYHKTMENYALAKQELFKKLKSNGKAIINFDDEAKKYFMLDENTNITYGFSGGDYHISKYTMGSTSSQLTYKYLGKDIILNTSLIGKYNLYNLMCVITVLTEEGIDIDVIKEVVSKISTPPGRMDKVNYKSNAIIVDYAHTPDAISKIIETVKEVTKGSVYTVFGATGDRDRTKRPIMFEIVAKSSKYAIITNDDPHCEDPLQIVSDLTKGTTYTNYKVELNRGNAIKMGIDLLNDNDVLLVLGKGHEDYIIMCHDKIPFNDKKAVIEYLEKK